MAYDSKPAAAAALRDDFHRSERIVVLLGSAALGLLAGCFAALALGRTGAGIVYFAAAPMFVVALYLAYATLRDAAERKALGCTVAAVVAILSLLLWPVVALFLPASTPWFWIAPTLMIGSLFLLASCWGGFQGAVYRTMGEAASLCAIAGFLGLPQVLT